MQLGRKISDPPSVTHTAPFQRFFIDTMKVSYYCISRKAREEHRGFVLHGPGFCYTISHTVISQTTFKFIRRYVL